MTITKAALTGSWGTFSIFGGSTYYLRYELEGDDAKQSVPAILDDLAALGGPGGGSVYDDDVSARASNFEVRQRVDEGAQNSYEVTVTFTPAPKNQTNQPLSSNPAEWEPVWWEETERASVPIATANNLPALSGIGRGEDEPGLIVNAAGVPPDTLPEVELDNRILVIRKNYLTYAAVSAVRDAYELTYNDGPFYDRPAFLARFKSITPGRPAMYRGTKYIETIIRVNLDRTDQTIIKIPNVGRHEIVSGKYRRILDEFKVPVSEPVPLEQDGTVSTTGSSPVDIHYRRHTGADYSALEVL